MILSIDTILLLLLIMSALTLAAMKNLFSVAMLLGIYSLQTATLFVTLDAVDVGLAEAAVGGGISTLLFLAALSLCGKQESYEKHRPTLAIVVVVVTGLFLIYATQGMPYFGDINAAIHQHVVPRYINQSPQEIGLPNVVTSVLASYRGFDTLGELAVIFTAGIGVLFLLEKNTDD